MAVVSFSIKTSQEKHLESFLKEGESLNLCAKRLLLGLLKGDSDESLDDSLDDSQVSLFGDRFEALEQSLGDLKERISKIEQGNIESDRIEALEQKLEQVEKFYKDITELDDLENTRLKEVEKRLEALESAIIVKESTNSKQNGNEGISSHQLAEILGCDRTTISRWKQKGDPRLANWEFKGGKWFPKDKSH